MSNAIASFNPDHFVVVDLNLQNFRDSVVPDFFKTDGFSTTNSVPETNASAVSDTHNEIRTAAWRGTSPAVSDTHNEIRMATWESIAPRFYEMAHPRDFLSGDFLPTLFRNINSAVEKAAEEGKTPVLVVSGMESWRESARNEFQSTLMEQRRIGNFELPQALQIHVSPPQTTTGGPSPRLSHPGLGR